MKGLLIKDFYIIKKQCYFTFILAAFFLILYAFMQTNIFPLMFSILFISATLVNLLYYDDFYKWNTFEITMPVSRKEIVTEKYLILLIILIPSILISSSIYFFINKDIFSTLNILYALLSIGLILPIIIFPFYYKFGYGKARLMTLIVSGICGAIIGGLGIAKSSQSTNILNTMPNLYYFVFPLIIISLVLISYFISLKVYSKREF